MRWDDMRWWYGWDHLISSHLGGRHQSPYDLYDDWWIKRRQEKKTLTEESCHLSVWFILSFTDYSCSLSSLNCFLKICWFNVNVFIQAKYKVFISFHFVAIAYNKVLVLQDHRQFQQRYYEFLDYFRPKTGPVFLKICGESSCNGIPNDYLTVSSLPLFWFAISCLSLLHITQSRGLVTFLSDKSISPIFA